MIQIIKTRDCVSNLIAFCEARTTVPESEDVTADLVKGMKIFMNVVSINPVVSAKASLLLEQLKLLNQKGRQLRLELYAWAVALHVKSATAYRFEA